MFRTLTRFQLVTDVVVAALFFLVQFGLLFSTEHGYITGIVLLLFSSALAMRRASPTLALVAAWAAAVGQMGANLDAPQFFDLAVLPVLFAVGSYGGKALRRIGLASAIVGSVIAAVYIVIRNGVNTDALFNVGTTAFDLPPFLFSSAIILFGCVAVLVLSWTLGLLARTARLSRERGLAQAAAERVVVVEQERNRIARDMHDVVAHSLAVVIAQADGARYVREADPSAVDEALLAISATAREALGDVRILLAQLRHSQEAGPQPVLADLDRVFDQVRSSGLTVDRTTTGPERPLAAGEQLAVFRIVQEALTNALRHGDAAQPVEVRFAWDERDVAITVTNSVGSALPNPGGHGLAGMNERAMLVGGTLDTAVVDGRFVVNAVIPITPEA